jgi:hypothetical protein
MGYRRKFDKKPGFVSIYIMEKTTMKKIADMTGEELLEKFTWLVREAHYNPTPSGIPEPYKLSDVRKELAERLWQWEDLRNS